MNLGHAVHIMGVCAGSQNVKLGLGEETRQVPGPVQQ